MKLFCIANQSSGIPAISNLPFAGWVLCGKVGSWGAYLFSGTAAQLAAINALPQIFGICVVTESGDVKWAELDGTIASATRLKLNAWLTARGYPTIPAGATYKQVVLAVYQRLNALFELNAFDVAD